MDLIAAVLFTVLALIQCYFLTNTVQLYGRFNVFVLIRLLWLAACVLTAVALYRRKRDRTGKGILFIGLGILTFMTFYDFFNGFRTNAYAVYESYYSYYSGLHSSYHFNLFCMIPSLIQVVGYLSILALAVVQLTGYAQKYREQTKMLWFVPAVLIAASLILGVIFSILFRLFGKQLDIPGSGDRLESAHLSADDGGFSSVRLLDRVSGRSGKEAEVSIGAGGNERCSAGKRCAAARERIHRHGKMRAAPDLYVRYLLAHMDLPYDPVSEPR